MPQNACNFPIKPRFLEGVSGHFRGMGCNCQATAAEVMLLMDLYSVCHFDCRVPVRGDATPWHQSVVDFPGLKVQHLPIFTHIYHCLVAQFCEVGRSPCLCFCEVGKSCAWCGRQSAVQSVDALAWLLLSEDGEDLLSMQLWHQQSLGCLIGYTTHLKQGRL